MSGVEITRKEQVQRRFKDGVRKIHVIPRIVDNP